VFTNIGFLEIMGIGDRGVSGSFMVKYGSFILVCVCVDCGKVYVRGDEVIRSGLIDVFVWCWVSVILGCMVVSEECV